MKAKRLTIELDPALHTRLKVYAVMSGKSITDIIRELVERNVPPLEQAGLLARELGGQAS